MRILTAVLAISAIAVGSAAQRPPVMGNRIGVSAGHPLTTAAAFEVLIRGGNAFDAGVAAMLVGGVVEQDLYSLGGEGLVLVYPRSEKKVTSIVGQGWAPKAVDVDWYLTRNKDLRGEGLDPAVVPGAIHAALTVLERWGTMSYEDVSARAIEYARDGFPLRPRTLGTIKGNLEFIQKWPDNARNWLKADGSLYTPGDTIKLPDLARTLQRMVEAERGARRRGRVAGIVAARDRFYKGDLATEMVAFLKKHDAPFDVSDFAEFYAKVEEPVSVDYRGFTVYKHGFGSQGPTLLQTLNILEQFDLKALKRNSADYLHLVTEAMKLGYADRDTYYADPGFVAVPAKGLLSKDYAKQRAALIDMKQASPTQVAGDPTVFDPNVKTWPYWVAGKDVTTSSHGASADAMDADSGRRKDTTHIAVIDKDGNVFDATPSGGWINGAVILGSTGIGMSVRWEQFYLDKQRAAQIRPRSRPRYTLTPGLVFKDGEPLMAIGTPGGDNQEQTVLQAFLDIVEFWDEWYPNLHTALEWPRVQTSHFYGSFWPHRIGLKQLSVETGVAPEVIEELKRRGHELRVTPPFSMSGCATVVLIDPSTRSRFAGADPRRDCYAIAQ